MAYETRETDVDGYKREESKFLLEYIRKLHNENEILVTNI